VCEDIVSCRRRWPFEDELDVRVLAGWPGRIEGGREGERE
jgi:hypothetical protein